MDALVTAGFFVVLFLAVALFLRFSVLGRGFSVPLRTMLRRPVTHEYPENPKPPAPRFHGRHQLNRYPDGLEKCIGCELCAWACPADAIYVQGADNTEDARFSPGERYAEDYQINYNRCIFCGLCIEACPTRALTMVHDYELSADHREDLIYTKDRLLLPLAEGMQAPPHTDREVRERGLNYYGGLATSPPTLHGGEFAPAANAPSARARAVVPPGPWGGGGEGSGAQLPGPQATPPDGATVGRTEAGGPGGHPSHHDEGPDQGRDAGEA